MDEVTQNLTQALTLMQAALSFLDKTDAAYDVGAHLDLAIGKLSDLLASSGLLEADPVRNTQTH